MDERRIACHKCGHTWTFLPPLGRRDECPKCHADAKVCLNCRFHDRGAHHECREEQAEWVKEKAEGNFCGFFEAKAEQGGVGDAEAKARAKLAALFGSKS
jgi:hypothetical protein